MNTLKRLRAKLKHKRRRAKASMPSLIRNQNYADEIANLEDLEVRTGGTVSYYVPLRIEQTLRELMKNQVIESENVFQQFLPEDSATNERITTIKKTILSGVGDVAVNDATYAYQFLVRTFAHFKKPLLSADVLGRMLLYECD